MNSFPSFLMSVKTQFRFLKTFEYSGPTVNVVLFFETYQYFLKCYQRLVANSFKIMGNILYIYAYVPFPIIHQIVKKS